MQCRAAMTTRWRWSRYVSRYRHHTVGRGFINIALYQSAVLLLLLSVIEAVTSSAILCVSESAGVSTLHQWASCLVVHGIIEAGYQHTIGPVLQFCLILIISSHNFKESTDCFGILSYSQCEVLGLFLPCVYILGILNTQKSDMGRRYWTVFVYSFHDRSVPH